MNNSNIQEFTALKLDLEDIQPADIILIKGSGVQSVQGYPAGVSR